MARRNGDGRMATAAVAVPRVTRSAVKGANQSRAWADDDSDCGDGYTAAAAGTPVPSNNRAVSLHGTDVPAPDGAAPDGAAPDGAVSDEAALDRGDAQNAQGANAPQDEVPEVQDAPPLGDDMPSWLAPTDRDLKVGVLISEQHTADERSVQMALLDTFHNAADAMAVVNPRASASPTIGSMFSHQARLRASPTR